jgi:hypothetical protein
MFVADLKKMAQNNGDFTAKECRAVMKYLFLKVNSAKKFLDMSVIFGDKFPSFSTVKNWVARLEQEVLGRTNRLLSCNYIHVLFDTTWTA